MTVGKTALEDHPASVQEGPAGKAWRSAMLGLLGSSEMAVLAALALILAAWEAAVAVFHVPRYLIPPPGDVLLALQDQWRLIAAEALATLKEVLLGFVVAIVTAIPSALLIVYSRVFERLFSPLVVISQAVPKIAIAPLFLAWFGFGETPKVLIAALIAYFPMLISATVGLKGIDPEFLSLSQSMGASALRTFWKVRLPCALPNFFAGFKVAITFSVIGAIVGEFVGGDHGIGYLIQMANGLQRLDLMFAALIVLSLIAVVLYYAVEFLERRFVFWHHSAVDPTL